MAKRIYNIWKLKWPTLCGYLLLMAIVWLAGVGILSLIVGVLDKEATYTTLATFLLFLCVIFFTIINTFVVGNDFNMAISMGATRKETYISQVIIQIVTTAIYVGITAVSYHAEKWLYKMWYPTREFEDAFSICSNYKVMLVLIILLPAVSVLLGAIFYKLSSKGMIAFWMAWAFFFIVLPQGADYITENPESPVSKAVFGAGSFLMNLPALFQILSIIVAATMFFLLGMLLLRKEAARI